MKKWQRYVRKGYTLMRPYIKGEDLTGISVSKEDDPEKDMGMIGCNPDNQKDQWYVAKAYFEKNFDLHPDEKAKSFDERRDDYFDK